MVEIKDTLIFVPFALLYNMFFHKLVEMIYSDIEPLKRFRKSIALLFSIGILSMVIGFLVLPEHPQYDDPNMKLGILIGGILLLSSSVTNNWGNLGEMGKLISLGLLIICIMGTVYGWIDMGNLGF